MKQVAKGCMMKVWMMVMAWMTVISLHAADRDTAVLIEESTKKVQQRQVVPSSLSYHQVASAFHPAVPGSIHGYLEDPIRTPEELEELVTVSNYFSIHIKKGYKWAIVYSIAGLVMDGTIPAIIVRDPNTTSIVCLSLTGAFVTLGALNQWRRDHAAVKKQQEEYQKVLAIQRKHPALVTMVSNAFNANPNLKFSPAVRAAARTAVTTTHVVVMQSSEDDELL
jgi:hypothetical protein